MMTQKTHRDQDGIGAGMKTIRHVFAIAAPRETVFHALTTADGLAGWWTTRVQADESAVGAEIAFTFRGAFNPRMHITALDPPARVRWQGVDGYAAWGRHTFISFELEETGGGTTVQFRHEISADRNDDAVAAANFNWGYYLDSLRLLCETGRGKPFQSGNPRARVGASSIG